VFAALRKLVAEGKFPFFAAIEAAQIGIGEARPEADKATHRATTNCWRVRSRYPPPQQAGRSDLPCIAGLMALYQTAPLSPAYNQMAAAYVASCLPTSAAPVYPQTYVQSYPTYSSYPSSYYGYVEPNYPYGGYGYGIPIGLGLGLGFAHGFHP
jgi:hypothetical protein